MPLSRMPARALCACWWVPANPELITKQIRVGGLSQQLAKDRRYML